MNRLTASEARQLVEASKIKNIYRGIVDRAKMGNTHMDVPYISQILFEQLIRDGFKIYAEDGEVELTRYNENYMFVTRDFEIDWEA